jgi:hypothetical protein
VRLAGLEADALALRSCVVAVALRLAGLEAEAVCSGRGRWPPRNRNICCVLHLAAHPTPLCARGEMNAVLTRSKTGGAQGSSSAPLEQLGAKCECGACRSKQYTRSMCTRPQCQVCMRCARNALASAAEPPHSEASGMCPLFKNREVDTRAGGVLDWVDAPLAALVKKRVLQAARMDHGDKVVECSGAVASGGRCTRTSRQPSSASAVQARAARARAARTQASSAQPWRRQLPRARA